MLLEHREELPRFLTEDPMGTKLLDFYQLLNEELADKDIKDLAEIEKLNNGIQRIRSIVETQQKYAHADYLWETLDPTKLIEEALLIRQHEFEKQSIEISSEPASANHDLLVRVQRSKLLYIFINLLSNAIDAVLMNPPGNRKIGVKILTSEEGKDEKIILTIWDNGIGIEEENLTKIFQCGFTTKEQGTGFNLHNCANFMSQMGGSLKAASDGPGKGALFTLYLSRIEPQH